MAIICVSHFICYLEPFPTIIGMIISVCLGVISVTEKKRWKNSYRDGEWRRPRLNYYFLLSTLWISSVDLIPAYMKSQQKKLPKKIYLINPANSKVLEPKACVCRHLSMSEINPISDFGFAHFSLPSCLFVASTTHDGNPQNHSHHSSGQRVNAYLIDGERLYLFDFEHGKELSMAEANVKTLRVHQSLTSDTFLFDITNLFPSIM